MRRTAAHAHHLSASLRLGTGYDWLLAAAILLAHPGLMQALHFPRPADLFLFRLAAMPLLLFPIVYLAAAHDPPGRAWAVKASIMLRAVGGAFLAALALSSRPPGMTMYLWLGLVDIAWAFLHASLWSRVRRSR